MPSDAQKEAGNYPMHRLRLHGLAISIENRKGTMRSGKSPDGSAWSVVMPYDYGYFLRTLGADGDHVDVFIGPKRESQFVVIVNQYDRQTGKFDEVKVGLGYESLDQARTAYRAGYRGANVPRAEFKTTTVQRLKEWLKIKQTWAAFDLSSRERLTNFATIMKRTPQQEKDKPSIARRVASVVVPAAIIGSTLAYKHYTRPKVPTPARDPALSPRGAFGVAGGEARRAVIGDVGNPRTTEWLTESEHAGVTARPKPSKFYEKPGATSTAHVAPVVAMPGVKLNKPPGRKLSLGAARILGLVQFNTGNEAFNNMLGASDRISTAYRTGRRIVPWLKRGTQAAEDTADIASGKHVPDPFYKKAWFKAGALGAAIGAPVLAARKVNAWHQQDAKYPNSLAHTAGGGLKEAVVKAARGLDEKWVKKGALKGVARTPLLTAHDGPMFAAKIKSPVLLRAVITHLKNFDYSDRAGWDLRDARGKSARVFAPGSNKRVRREKTWGEKTENIRAERNIAAVGAVAGVVGALHQAGTAAQANIATRTAEKVGRDRVVAGIKGGIAKGKIILPRTGELVTKKAAGLIPHDFKKALGAKIRTVNLSRKSSPALHRLTNAIGDNLPDAERPEIPGEGAVRFVLENKTTRSPALRILGAGTVLGAGALAGAAFKRPKLAAAASGVAAGGILFH